MSGTSAPELIIAHWEGGELRTRHYVTRVNGTDSSDYFRPADGARWSDHPYAPGAEFPGAHGGAQTYCGRLGYGVIYHASEGPAVTCTDCLWSRADDATVANVAPSPEETSAGPVDLAVIATAAILGTSEADAREHLEKIHRETVVDPEAQQALARTYDALPEHDTSANLAWEAFAHETLSQANVLRSLGITWQVVDSDPYANVAAEMFADLRNGHRRIKVLSSAVTGGHPLLSDTVNDTFRAVHDILGHAATGRGFDRHGEEAAFRAHARLYSPLARQALATETRGQNASMIDSGGVFSPQKVAVLPSWWRADTALKPRSPEATDAARADAARRHAAQGLGTWNP